MKIIGAVQLWHFWMCLARFMCWMCFMRLIYRRADHWPGYRLFLFHSRHFFILSCVVRSWWKRFSLAFCPPWGPDQVLKRVPRSVRRTSSWSGQTPCRAMLGEDTCRRLTNTFPRDWEESYSKDTTSLEMERRKRSCRYSLVNGETRVMITFGHLGDNEPDTTLLVKRLTFHTVKHVIRLLSWSFGVSFKAKQSGF